MKNVKELFPSILNSAFDPREALLTIWGDDNWGVNNDVGQIKKILMKRPGKEMEMINEHDCVYKEEYSSWVHKEGRGYWVSEDKSLPNIPLMQQQHDNLANILREEGAEVIYLESADTLSKSVNVRDVLTVTPGGAVLSNMGPVMRKSEIRYALKTLGEIGMPIAGCIIGDGLFEGGSFAILNNKLAVAGLSKRGNQEGINQLKSILAIQGMDLITIPLVGHSLHTDSAFVMVDYDKALIKSYRLPYYFLEELERLGIKGIEAAPGERWAINCLAVKPGKVIMAQESVRTIERLQKEGVDVIPIDYSEIQKNGGGIHCSTNPLSREAI